MKTADNRNDYQLVRVKNRETGKPTTISLNPILFIKLCQCTRDLKAATALVRKFAEEVPLDEGETLAGAVSDAVAGYIKQWKAVAA